MNGDDEIRVFAIEGEGMKNSNGHEMMRDKEREIGVWIEFFSVYWKRWWWWRNMGC